MTDSGGTDSGTTFNNEKGTVSTSIYVSQCEACLARNQTIFQAVADNLAESWCVPLTNDAKKAYVDRWAKQHPDDLYYWCAADASCKTGGEPCGEGNNLRSCVAPQLSGGDKLDLRGGGGQSASQKKGTYTIKSGDSCKSIAADKCGPEFANFISTDKLEKIFKPSTQCQSPLVVGDTIQYDCGYKSYGQCLCTSCTDVRCLNDYINPACGTDNAVDCGCAIRTSLSEFQVVGTDPAKRPSSRGSLVCEFASRTDTNKFPTGSFVSNEKLDERRKAETLLHRRNAAQLTAKQRWSQIVRGKGPLGPKVWASQTQKITIPNTRPCNKKNSQICSENPEDPSCQGCLAQNPKKENSVLCTGPPPKLCSPASSADVPRSPDPTKNVICMRKEVPLTRYLKSNVVYSSAGSTWPQTRWKPGMSGFPVGKAGSNQYERDLAEEERKARGEDVFGEERSFRVLLPAFPPTGGQCSDTDVSLCNRFRCEAQEILVCIGADGKPNIPRLDQKNLKFSWRPQEQIPYDPNGTGTSTIGFVEAIAAQETVREFDNSPCTDQDNGQFGNDVGASPPGKAGDIVITEPINGAMGDWERAILKFATGGGGIGKSSGYNSATKTCCGSGDWYPVSKSVTDSVNMGKLAIGQIRYSGCLTWASTQKENESTDRVIKGTGTNLVEPPKYPSPWNIGDSVSMKYLEVNVNPYNDTIFIHDTKAWTTTSFSTDPSYQAPTHGQWATCMGPISSCGSADENGLVQSYSGRGCGQPYTVSRWKPYIDPGGSADEYECPLVSSTSTTYTTENPTYEKVNSPKEAAEAKANPEMLGGAWAPNVFKCGLCTNDLTNILDGTKSYLTITYCFGAYCGDYAWNIDMVECSKKGGMGQWNQWSPPGKEYKNEPNRSGLVPELYTFTWYIDASSFNEATSAVLTVPCIGIVTGKPSSGQYVDPRPTMNGYAWKNTDTEYWIESSRAGGGWLGKGGSVIGTQAGGLGLRGCVLDPVCDVHATNITMALCK